MVRYAAAFEMVRYATANAPYRAYALTAARNLRNSYIQGMGNPL